MIISYYIYWSNHKTSTSNLNLKKEKSEFLVEVIGGRLFFILDPWKKQILRNWPERIQKKNGCFKANGTDILPGCKCVDSCALSLSSYPLLSSSSSSSVFLPTQNSTWNPYKNPPRFVSISTYSTFNHCCRKCIYLSVYLSIYIDIWDTCRCIWIEMLSR